MHTGKPNNYGYSVLLRQKAFNVTKSKLCSWEYPCTMPVKSYVWHHRDVLTQSKESINCSDRTLNFVKENVDKKWNLLTWASQEIGSKIKQGAFKGSFGSLCRQALQTLTCSRQRVHIATLIKTGDLLLRPRFTSHKKLSVFKLTSWN